MITVVGPDGVVRYQSPSVTRILGFEPSVVLGQYGLDYIHPDDQPAVRAIVADLRQRPGSAASIEYRCRTVDGSWLEVESVFQDMLNDPHVAGLVINSRDVTARKRAEQQVENRERQQAAVAELGQRALVGGALAELMEVAVDLVARTLDVECGAILELRPDTRDFVLRASVGWPPGFLGRVVDDGGTISQPAFTQLRREPVIVDDLRAETRFKPSTPLRERGVVSGVSVIISDPATPFGVLEAHTTRRRAFTDDDVYFLQAIANVIAAGLERVHVEDELQRSNLRLEETLTQLRATQQQVIQHERLRALGQMASGIAHDFNNSLGMVVGFLELLLVRPGALDDMEKVRHYLEMMETAALDAARVVSRLREFYRFREDNDVLVPTPLNQVIEQAISLTQPRWKDQALAQGVSVRVETDLAEIPTVLGNETELREVMTNLIFNGVDALAVAGTVTIRTREEGERVVLQVQDSGGGMTEEVRQHCLEPFFTTKGHRGSGMGLAMTYGIVVRHKGSIQVESEVGKGTTVTITLPVGQQVAIDRPLEPRRDDARRPLSVLVVDDAGPLRQILREFLIADGHTVETANDGVEGLRKYLEGHFDLVVTDRAMPEMNGDQLAAAIKERAPTQPIILLTGFGEMMQAAGERPEGVDLVVSKPVTLKTLRLAVGDVMSNAARSG